jgi:hypothetical protein
LTREERAWKEFVPNKVMWQIDEPSFARRFVLSTIQRCEPTEEEEKRKGTITGGETCCLLYNGVSIMGGNKLICHWAFMHLNSYPKMPALPSPRF